MKSWQTRLLITIGIPFLFGSASAAERYRYFTGVRQMGMGGAASAVVNDETSLLSNPAGLGKLRQSITTIFDPEITGGAYNTSIMGATPAAQMTTMQGLYDSTVLSPGKHWNAKAQVLPSFVVPNFGVGIFSKASYDAEVDALGANFSVNYFSEYAFILGYAIRLFDGRIKLGFNGKVMNRVVVNETLPTTPALTTLEWKDYVREGGAIGSDGGIVITLPWDMLPTLSATVHDVGGTNYDQGTGYFYKPDNRRPPFVRPTTDVAVALFPIHSNRVRSTLTLEVSDVQNINEEADAARRYHGGLEINIGDIFYLRGGMNQRYWTAGVELDMSYFQFQFASYGEELGPSDGSANREDRRYVGKLAIRF